MAVSSLLGVGRTGLVTHTLGSGMASHGASNVATPGFSRRALELAGIAPPPRHGGGVQALGIRRVIDPFVERRLLGARADAGFATRRAMALGTLDRVLSDDAGLGAALDAFETAVADLAAYPGDRAARTQMLARAEGLATAFRSAATEIRLGVEEADQRIEMEVREVSGALEEIARLGEEIAKSEVRGEEASDLRDHRDELVRQVADRVPVTVVTHPDGRMSLLLKGGLPLVSPDGASPLQTVRDPVTGRVRIERVTAGAAQDVTNSVTSGSIGGLLAARDGALADARADLDQLAFDVASAYNAVHAAGFGLDGVAGRDLFAPPAAAAGAAEAMAVSAAVAGNPDAIGASLDPLALPGDNRNALALAALADAPIAGGATRTVQGALADLLAEAGSAIRAATEGAGRADAVLAQTQALRDSVSGVSLDEQMLDLMQYQRAYQASLRVIEVADQMLEDLLALKR